MKELKLQELTLEQKIGMTLCANLAFGEEDVEDALQMIREHRLGAVWVQPRVENHEDIIRRVRETADYPILIMCDSELGYKETLIPDVLSMTASGAKSEYAFSFGRAVAAQHRLKGYNTICNPLLDICYRNCPCGSVMRTFGSDKKTVARLGGALARGMHEGGCLSVAKHYPGGGGKPYDSHMRESCLDISEEKLVDENLYPYIELQKQGLIDGIMTGHNLVPQVDPEYPASLSRKLLDLLRDHGFNGFYITDALCMMGVVLKYGVNDPHGLCIRAGNSLALSWAIRCREGYAALVEGYQKGLYSDADLDEAVTHILEAQHKVKLLPTPERILDEDLENLRHINEDCICAVCDEGVSPVLPADGKHLFIITTDKDIVLDSRIGYTPGPREWYLPQKIADQIRELFPNSGVMVHPEFPNSNVNIPLFDKQAEYDDLVFLTATQTQAYVGREQLTSRLVDLMDALQSTHRIAAHLHFGNPFVATYAPHVPRVLIGLASTACVEQTLRILHGDAPANGTLPYDLEFHKEGDIFW